VIVAIDPFLVNETQCKFGVIGYFDDDLIAEGKFCDDCKFISYCPIHSKAISRMNKTSIYKKLKSKIVEYLSKIISRKGRNEQMLTSVLEDWADDDTAIRDLASKYLTKFEVDGDSYGVPPIVDVVERLCKKLDEYRGG